MQHFIKFILILALAYLSSFVVPFWGVAIAGFIGSITVRSTHISSFLIGFIAVFILWGLMAFYVDIQTSSILTDRISQLFSLDPPFLILITGVLGGITAGLGSWAGSMLRGGAAEKGKYYQ